MTIIDELIKIAREGFSRGWDGLDAKERLDRIDEIERTIQDRRTHATAIARDIALGHTSEDIRTEIIREVGMMADARTPEMRARYDAAIERAGKRK